MVILAIFIVIGLVIGGFIGLYVVLIQAFWRNEHRKEAALFFIKFAIGIFPIALILHVTLKIFPGMIAFFLVVTCASAGYISLELANRG